LQSGTSFQAENYETSIKAYEESTGCYIMTSRST
jgi:hypothetical protein